MKNISYKIEQYVGRKVNFIPGPNREVGITTEADQVPYIYEWNIDTHSKPTDEQLNAFVSEAQTAKNAFMVTKLRRRAYKTIPDQLDQLYHDITAGKLDETGEWYKAIKKVKDDNPKS